MIKCRLDRNRIGTVGIVRYVRQSTTHIKSMRVHGPQSHTLIQLLGFGNLMCDRTSFKLSITGSGRTQRLRNQKLTHNTARCRIEVGDGVNAIVCKVQEH